MAANGLIDTGAIVAILDPNDRWHTLCLEALPELRLPLITSEAVLTELFHLAGKAGIHRSAVWSFVHSSLITLATIRHEELSDLRELMAVYADRPMDFADATLVHLAERESIGTIFTTDHNDFETYRIHGKQRFRIVPSRRP